LISPLSRVLAGALAGAVGASAVLVIFGTDEVEYKLKMGLTYLQEMANATGKAIEHERIRVRQAAEAERTSNPKK